MLAGVSMSIGSCSRSTAASPSTRTWSALGSRAGFLFALSAAAWGEVVLGDGGEIVTQNFDRYPIVRMRPVPQIEVHMIESSEKPTGVGEVSAPSVAPDFGERHRGAHRHPHPRGTASAGA